MQGFSLPFQIALAASLSIATPVAGQGIIWAKSYSDAAQLAAAEKRVMFVAMHADGAPACDAFVNEHYRDSAIAKLAKASVSVFCDATEHSKARCKRTKLRCHEHRACNDRVRIRVLNLQPDDPLGAPIHLFVGPDGKVISSVLGRFREGQLEWAWADAIRTIDPKFEWQLSNRAYAPRKLRYGFKRTTHDKPPTQKQIADAVDKITKGGLAAWRELADSFSLVIRSCDEKARDSVSNMLSLRSRWVPSERKADILNTIGDTSPPVWAEVVIPWVGHRRSAVRWSAVVALEKLAHPSATKALMNRWKVKDEKPQVRARLLRALGECGAANRKVGRLLARIAKSDKDPDMRASAVVGAAPIEDRKLIAKLVPSALSDPSAKVRAAAAWVVGIRRDARLLEHVTVVAEGEKNEEAKSMMDAARTVIEKRAGSEALEAFLDTMPGKEPPVRTPR